MRPRVVVFFLLATVLAEINSVAVPQKAIRFCYQYLKLNPPPAVVAPSVPAKTYQSMTLCLRINIIGWNSYIVVSEMTGIRLIFYSFSDLKGKLMVSGIGIEFYFHSALSISTSSWNSVCLSYDGTSKLWSVTVNGEEVLWEGDFGGPEWVDLSKVSLGSYGFNGFITDVNAWSRALTKNEIVDFTFDNLTQTSSPDVISWQRANVSFSSKCPEMVTLDADLIKSNNAALFSTEVFTFSSATNAIEAQRRCSRLNGKMFYPRDAEQLKLVARRFDICFKFWVPFKKLQSKATDKWVFTDRRDTDEEQDLGLWPVKAGVPDGDCMYFDVLQGAYFSANCNESSICYCVLCELENYRLIYRMHSRCESSWSPYIDSLYVLAPGTGNFYIKLFLDQVCNDNFLEAQFFDFPQS